VSQSSSITPRCESPTRSSVHEALDACPVQCDAQRMTHLRPRRGGASCAQETRAINRMVGFGLCFGGLTFFGILVGTISGQTRVKLETLRQGQNAPVVENGHLVVAGYNRNMPALLRAMCYTHEIKLQQVLLRALTGQPSVLTCHG
jgi:hypothetical protein